MAKASIEKQLSFADYPDVSAGIVRWLLSTICLHSSDRKSLIGLGDQILKKWREYTDESTFVLAKTDGDPHNAITPIARMRDGKYELDLVLHNYITIEEH